MKKNKILLSLLFLVSLSLGACNSPDETSSSSSSSSETSEMSKTLQSISLSGDYKTEFKYGESFTYAGLIVTAHYSDSSSTTVTDYQVSTPQMSELVTEEITVSYEEDDITKYAFYNITIITSADQATISSALKDVNDAFNELDIEDYSSLRWEMLVNTLKDAINGINNAKTNQEVIDIRDNTLDTFANAPKLADIVKDTWFDYHSSDSNYVFDRDSDNNLVIYYPTYPGRWVYVGTKSNLITDVSINNVLSITFRNDIDENIEVCLQATDSSGSYKVDSGITNVLAHETKTMTLDYDLEISKLYFFVDSCSEHTRSGKVTILDTSLTYVNRTPSSVYESKTVSINQSMTIDDGGSLTSYTLTDADHPLYIERVDALVAVNFNGNGSSSQWFGLHLYAGSSHKSISSSDAHAQSTTFDGVAGENYYMNYEISSSSKLMSGNSIYMDISYAADGLTFTVVSYTFYYGLWKNIETEEVAVNSVIYENGSSKDTNGDSIVASIPYSSFTKTGRVSKMEVSFTTINMESYGKSQIYIQGFDFTTFSSGNNNVLNIGRLMNTGKTGEEVKGTVTIYPTSTINLTKDASINFTCWWSSATYIRIDSITMYTDNILPPDSVESLEAHPIDSGMVLTWAISTNATSYLVYVDDELYNTVNSTYITINGLTNGQLYKFTVVSSNASGNSIGVSISSAPVEGATYDTFIEGLNTTLEETIGEQGISDLFNASSSYLSSSNNERLKAVIEKMQNGEETTVAYFGGSITVGETADLKDENNHAKGYAYYSYQWLKRQYDVMNKSKFINASICGTGSEIGIVRAQTDMLQYNPDLIFIEFAANNGTTEFYKQTYESLIRKCLSLPSSPCVILVFSGTYYTNDVSGTEAYMSAVGNYYSLPMFSMHKGLNAICSSLSKDRTDPIFALFSTDGTHPSDEGHMLYAKALCYFLRNLISRSTDSPVSVPTAPSVTNNDKYENLESFDNTNAGSNIVSLGSFVASNTATNSTYNQSDVTAFINGWKKTDTTVNEPMVLNVNAKNFVLIYEAGNSAVSGDPTGNVIVTYTNDSDPTDTGSLTWDVSKTIKQSTSGSTEITSQSSGGWENPVGVLIFDKENVANYTITIEMENSTGICTIMAFGYSK